MSDPNASASWVTAAITALIAIVAGFWALMHRLFVPRGELVTLLERLEERHDAQIEKLDQTIRALHEDNTAARHRLRDTLSAPINNLNGEIIRLRESIERGYPR